MLAAGVVLGVLLGLLTMWVWTPAEGVVVQINQDGDKGVALLDNGRGIFSSTGWFVILAAGGGLLTGVVTALATRGRELLTMTAGLCSAVLFEVVLWLVARLVGPDDPVPQVAGTAVETVVQVPFGVSGAAPWLAAPVGMLVGFLAVVLVLRPRQPGDPRG